MPRPMSMNIPETVALCKGHFNPYAYQSASQRILYALQSAPTDPDGWITISVRQLARRAGLAATAGAVSPALMDLEQRGCIVRDAQHRITLLPDPPALPARAPTIRARLWALLRERATIHPLITSTNLALATALGCAEGRVSAALRRLQRDGWIRPAHGTRGWVWCGQAGDQWADAHAAGSDQWADDAGQATDHRTDGLDHDPEHHPPTDRSHPPADRVLGDQQADAVVVHPPTDRSGCGPYGRSFSAPGRNKPMHQTSAQPRHAQERACAEDSESERDSESEKERGERATAEAVRSHLQTFVGTADLALHRHLCTRYQQQISPHVAARLVYANPGAAAADFDQDVQLGFALYGFGIGKIIKLWFSGQRISLPPRYTVPTVYVSPTPTVAPATPPTAPERPARRRTTRQAASPPPDAAGVAHTPALALYQRYARMALPDWKQQQLVAAVTDMAVWEYVLRDCWRKPNGRTNDYANIAALLDRYHREAQAASRALDTGAHDYRRQAHQIAPPEFTAAMLDSLTGYLAEGYPVEAALTKTRQWHKEWESETVDDETPPSSTLLAQPLPSAPPPAVPSLPVLWEQLHQAVVARSGHRVAQALVGAQLTACDPVQGLIVVGAATAAHKTVLESQAHVIRQVLAEQYGLAVHVVVNMAHSSR